MSKVSDHLESIISGMKVADGEAQAVALMVGISRNDMEELLEVIKSYDQELSDSAILRDNAVVLVKKLEKETDYLREQIGYLNADLEKAREEKKISTATLQKAIQYHAVLQGRNSELGTECRKYKKQLYETSTGELFAKISDLEKHNQMLTELLEIAEAEMAVAKNTEDVLKSSVGQLTTALQAANDAMEKGLDHKFKQQEHCQALVDRISRLEEMCAKSMNDLAAKDREIERLKERVPVEVYYVEKQLEDGRWARISDYTKSFGTAIAAFNARVKPTANENLRLVYAEASGALHVKMTSSMKPEETAN